MTWPFIIFFFFLLNEKVSNQVETFQTRWKGFHLGGKGPLTGGKVSTRVETNARYKLVN